VPARYYKKKRQTLKYVESTDMDPSFLIQMQKPHAGKYALATRGHVHSGKMPVEK
jgi:hypothetical protein